MTMKDLMASLALVVLYLIGPVAVYLTGGPFQWYMGLIVLSVSLAVLVNNRDRKKTLTLIEAVCAGFLPPVAVVTEAKTLVGTLVAAFLAGVLVTPWWQGVLFGWLGCGTVMMLYGLWNVSQRQKKAKPAT